MKTYNSRNYTKDGRLYNLFLNYLKLELGIREHFTLKTFIYFGLNSPTYRKIFNTWEKNKFTIEMSPIIELVDVDLEYIESNIVFTTVRDKKIKFLGIKHKPRKCNRCHVLREADEYRLRKGTSGNRYNICNECNLTNRRSYDVRMRRMFIDQVAKSKKRKHKPPEYTMEEFIVWVIEGGKYKELHANWVKSDYDIKLSPSCDRLNNNKGYSFDNIEIVTWDINNRRANTDVKNGKLVKGHTHLQVVVSDSSSKVLDTYISVRDCSRELNIPRTTLRRHI